MTKLSTDLTESNLQNLRVQEIMRLLQEHVKYATMKKFHRPITETVAKETKFPACFVQPKTWKPEKTATGKYDYFGSVVIYTYHEGNAPERAGEDMMRAVGIIDKLFSDNAEDDLISATPSHHFLSNVPFWIESELGEASESEALAFQRDTASLWLVAARIPFRYHDVLTP